VLLDSDGVVAVADFGISKQLEPKTELTSTFVGTVAYLAPERLRGAEYAAPADVWALGIVAVECALGSHPYSDATSFLDLALDLTQGEAPQWLHPDDFSQPLISTCAACLLSSPDLRPSCAELQESEFLLKHVPRADERGEGRGAHAAATLVSWTRRAFDTQSQALKSHLGADGHWAERVKEKRDSEKGSKTEDGDEYTDDNDDDDDIVVEFERREQRVHRAVVKLQSCVRGVVLRRELADMRYLLARLSESGEEVAAEIGSEIDGETGAKRYKDGHARR